MWTYAICVIFELLCYEQGDEKTDRRMDWTMTIGDSKHLYNNERN